MLCTVLTGRGLLWTVLATSKRGGVGMRHALDGSIQRFPGGVELNTRVLAQPKERIPVCLFMSTICV
jgi:hypothetical protein